MMNCMLNGFRYSLGGVLGHFPIYIGKKSVSLMYQLTRCYYSYLWLLFAWDIEICFSTDISGDLLSRNRKMSAYMYLDIQHIVV